MVWPSEVADVDEDYECDDDKGEDENEDNEYDDDKGEVEDED